MYHTLKKLLTTVAIIAVLAIPLSGYAANSEAININSASQIELQTIKGIGPKMADKIVQYREKHGQFVQVADLCNIKGIGEKSLQKIADQLCVK
ncbi:MAG: ComEA family DNA-binding protein [Desulfuromonas sp.]|nr:ComEA family DNA-binding protein [Desulfuromonas sp.]